MCQYELFKIINENNVKITDFGLICLYDFIEKVIESKNPMAYINNLKDINYILINNEKYIHLDDGVNILHKSKFKKCKNILNNIGINDCVLTYDNDFLVKFYNKKVVFIAYIGFYNYKNIYFLGSSDKTFMEDYEKYRQRFNFFRITFILECDYFGYIEIAMKQLISNLRVREQNHQFHINNNDLFNFFSTCKEYPIEHFICYMLKLSNMFQKTTNLELFEQLYKLSDNYKLKTEIDLKIKKIDFDTQIILKNLDLDIEKEKRKQLVMSKVITR